jgi:hypothetical protein
MTSEPVTSSEVFLWALYELGGADDFVDVEDAFFKAFQLAPLRLSWRTRQDLPDLKKCSKALRDAEGRKPKLMVKNGADKRRLTVAGQRWIEENFERLAQALGGGDRLVGPSRIRIPSRLVSQATQTAVFTDWVENGAITEQKWRVAEMLRCSPDSSRSVFHDRLETLRAAAYSSGRRDVLEFFDALLRERPNWF